MMKQSLSSTSALVLLWTDKSLYSAPVVDHYWSMLDLSSGIELYKKCNAIWPSYSCVINDRKWQIGKWSDEILTLGTIKQVIIFAAGWAPLGLELANGFKDCNVFEIDLDNMEAKAKLVSQISGAPKNIKFITADISNRNLCLNALRGSGWSADAPSLLIFEGISYYLKPGDLISLFSLPNVASRAILEYMIPYDQVEAKRREIPEKVFAAIAHDCQLKVPIEMWDVAEIGRRVPGHIIRDVTLSDIEGMKYKNNQAHKVIFPTPDSGWIQIADIELNCGINGD